MNQIDSVGLIQVLYEIILLGFYQVENGAHNKQFAKVL